jgi:hypothetical protein
MLPQPEERMTQPRLDTTRLQKIAQAYEVAVHPFVPGVLSRVAGRKPG